MIFEPLILTLYKIILNDLLRVIESLLECKFLFRPFITEMSGFDSYCYANR